MNLRLKQILLFISTPMAVGIVFFVLRNHVPSTILNHKYSFIFFLSCFIVSPVYYNYFHKINKQFYIYMGIAIPIFIFLGMLLARLKLEGDKEVKINVELSIAKQDVLQLFYIQPNKAVETEENSIKITANKSPDSQLLIFRLSDTLILNKLRLDLGTDSTVHHIKIEKIYATYNHEHLLLFNSTKNFTRFTPNQYAKQTTDEFLLSGINNNYDPFLYSDDISEDYLKLIQTKKHLPFPFLISFILVFSIFTYLLFFTEQVAFRTRIYTIASCIFILILFLPLISETFQIFKNENNEQRNLATKPVLSSSNIFEFPKQYEAYYNDNFGFRSWLIHTGGKIKYYLFNSSSLETVSIGKDSWMFLSGSFYAITPDLTKSNLYSDNDLKQAVKGWEDRKHELAADSIEYYKAFWPDKHYIYSEFMPFNMQLLNKDTIARCDQAIQYLAQKKSDVHIIDVRQELLNEKKNHTVHLKHDSHWNAYGGFIAYTKLLKQMEIKFPELKPHPLEDFNVTWHEETGGDLVNMLGIKSTELKPTFILKNDSSKTVVMPIDNYPIKTVIYENKAASSNLTLLVFRDSYTKALEQYLTLHFKKIVLIWDTPYSKELVKKVNPDIVLESYVTRYFK